MIDERELMQRIKIYLKGKIDQGMQSIDIHILNVEMKNLIDNMPKHCEWIPVSERLPEESGEYLVSYDCGDEEQGCMVVNFDACVGSFGYWHDEYDGITLGFLDSEFLEFETAEAWMPLPESYKPEPPELIAPMDMLAEALLRTFLGRME